MPLSTNLIKPVFHECRAGQYLIKKSEIQMSQLTLRFSLSKTDSRSPFRRCPSLREMTILQCIGQPTSSPGRFSLAAARYPRGSLRCW